MSSIEEYLRQALQKSGNAIIVTHRNPDGDALGSSLAWMEFLQQAGWKVHFISPTKITHNLLWMPGIEQALCYEDLSDRSKIHQIIDSAEVIYCLDFNSPGRLEDLGKRLLKSSALKIMIDHHLEPENFANICFSDTGFASTSEMIVELILNSGNENKISKAMAENLYTGMATDTGFFQFSNTSPKSMRYAALLLEKGAKPDVLSNRIHHVFSEDRLRFFGHCLLHKLKLVNNKRVAIIPVSQQEIKEFNLQQGDNEGLVNYPFKIQGVILSALFSEEPGKVKISLRSKGEFDVNRLAREHFSGGGHKNASGGMSTESLENTVARFSEIAEQIHFS
jgi:phosphoesterase RecJ-like protein